MIRRVLVLAILASFAVVAGCGSSGGGGGTSSSGALTSDDSLVADVNRQLADPDECDLYYDELYASPTVKAGNTVYFAANGRYGCELYKEVNGQAVLVKDIKPGICSSRPHELTAVGNTLYFVAHDGGPFCDYVQVRGHGWQIWKTDGTEEGTVMVTNIRPDFFVDPFELKDFDVEYPPEAFGGPHKLIAVGDKLFFVAKLDDWDHRELCVTDGTPEGTIQLTNWQEDAFGGDQSDWKDRNWAVLNGKLYFGPNGFSDRDLWVSDGTVLGTYKVVDLYPDNCDQVTHLETMGDHIYFKGYGTATFWEYSWNYTTGQIDKELVERQMDMLWKSDGTSEGTTYVLQPDWSHDYGSDPQPRYMHAFGDKLLYMQKASYVRTNTAQVGDGLDGEYENLGAELWITDGTSEGTKLLKDCYQGTSDGGPKNFVDAGDKVYFWADNYLQYGSGSYDYGRELWVTDGTPEGTRMVVDLYADSNCGWEYITHFNDGNTADCAVANGYYFFAYERQDTENNEGRELWRTDGTAAGTVLVADLVPGPRSSFPTCLSAVNNMCYFFAWQDDLGYQLYKTDGHTVTRVSTYAYTKSAFGEPGEIADFDLQTRPELDGFFYNEYYDAPVAEAKEEEGEEGNPWRKPVKVGTRVFFAAKDGCPEDDLDGYNVDSDEYTDDFYDSPRNFFPIHGVELWVSDGTAAGTKMVKDINQGSYSSNPKFICDVNGKAFFVASDLLHGEELWVSDGTEAGTKLVKDIWPGLGPTNNPDNYSYKMCGPKDLVAFNGKCYFSANDGIHGRELWVSDGTAAGTFMLKNICVNPDGEDNFAQDYFSYPDSMFTCSSPKDFVVVGNQLFFSAKSTYEGRELWVSDGTAEGTHMVKNISPWNAPYAGWMSTIEAGFDPQFVSEWQNDGCTKDITAFNGKVYFTANDAIHGRELWVSDGTEAGTHMVVNLLRYADGTPGYPDYYGLLEEPVDGTQVGDGYFCGNPQDLTVVGNWLFFSGKMTDGNGRDLYKTDGTAEGTVLVKNLIPGTYESTGNYTRPKWMTAVGDKLFFTADVDDGDGAGRELWVSDGTENGTHMVRDLTPEDGICSNPQFLTAFGNVVVFAAGDSDYEMGPGRELYVSDGTYEGTVLAADIAPGWAGDSSDREFTNGNPQGFCVVGDSLFFVAKDGTRGWELHKF